MKFQKGKTEYTSYQLVGHSDSLQPDFWIVIAERFGLQNFSTNRSQTYFPTQISQLQLQDFHNYVSPKQ